jgi:hypothetical protein
VCVPGRWSCVSLKVTMPRLKHAYFPEEDTFHRRGQDSRAVSDQPIVCAKFPHLFLRIFVLGKVGNIRTARWRNSEELHRWPKFPTGVLATYVTNRATTICDHRALRQAQYSRNGSAVIPTS